MTAATVPTRNHLRHCTMVQWSPPWWASTGPLIWCYCRTKSWVSSSRKISSPLTDLKVNPGRVVGHASEAHRPVLLTSRGRGVAVVQSVADFEAAEDERDFMRAVVAGLADLEAGREWSLTEVKERLGLG